MTRWTRNLILAASLTALPACASTPAQRGLMVFQQVCSACHGMEHVTYGDMSRLGLSPVQIRKWAADRQMPNGTDDNGDPKPAPPQPPIPSSRLTPTRPWGASPITDCSRPISPGWP